MTDGRLAYFMPEGELEAEVQRLEGRKQALESAIAERFMEARAAGDEADVTALSTELRAVKRQLVIVIGQRDGGACAGCGSDNFHWPTAKFLHGRTWCARCLKTGKGPAVADRSSDALHARAPSENAEPPAAHDGHSVAKGPTEAEREIEATPGRQEAGERTNESGD
jgi:hypothetical protein